MIIWQVKPIGSNQTITCTMAANNGNNAVPVVLSGKKAEKDQLLDFLNRSYGAFGHRIDAQLATPIDVDYALNQGPYEVTIEEGSELVSSYDPKLPEDAIT